MNPNGTDHKTPGQGVPGRKTPDLADAYVNACIICGDVTLGPERRFLSDGPPMGFCDRHNAMMAGDPLACVMYCMVCKQASYILHVAGYDGERILFAEDCPNCNPDFKTFKSHTWKAWTNENSSRNSLPPASEPPESSSTAPGPSD